MRRKARSSGPRRPRHIVKNPRFLAYFDGCCEPINPGGTASYGAVVFDRGQRVWECSELFLPQPGRERETSNNVAEYSGFVALLEYFIRAELQKEGIVIHGDSKLVIEQTFGDWKIHGGYYKPVAEKARELVKRFANIEGKWIPRDKNDIADELSKAELKKAGVEFRIQPEDDAT